MDTPHRHGQGLDQGHMPVTGKAIDYASGWRVPGHSHPTNQLIHAVRGVMVVAAAGGQWVVPPTRGLWMPAGVDHRIRMVGDVQVRTVYIRPDASPSLPGEVEVVGISALLRELILAAIEIRQPYLDDSRDGRLMRLLLDEVAVLPSLPLRLPQPSDPDLLTICRALAETPDDPSTLGEWAARLGVDAKTVQRRFARHTGMTFGQWRQQARLITALEQLAAGAKVVDVALNLGYGSPSAFTTMFKRQFGATPSTYFR
ncbi:AraC family transcriptional regulator [Parasulfuritortus cantonensis]|uniref:AraC family transcriptional regulator n=1 Tax=Parasulfuritortus cantonensis TaxID=2528202 RepID=A0A4R1BD48_9PROT|nr:helix-turn-helix transcriptional regulator [Parasulfuritortus cantonensis]TCJ14990.1 AraC family transcriptional regulator [Parasulfuritortus cantonensis]